jgi:hypothetical protein
MAQKVSSIRNVSFAADCIVGTSGVSKYADSGYVWALFNTKDIHEGELARYKDDPDDVEFAFRLTGWHAYNKGTGRAFAADPTVVVGRTRILVKQFRGLDI